jgi:transposase-like protein
MTPTKLSDSDKLEIISLYRQTDENTITLAKRYGVSSSTVRRMLQSSLSSEEYETLVQQKQKRSSHTPPPTTTTTVAEEVEEVEEVKEVKEVKKVKKVRKVQEEEEDGPRVSEGEELNSSESILGVRLTRTRRRSSSSRESLNSPSSSNSLNSLESDFTPTELPAPAEMNLKEEDYEPSSSGLAEMLESKGLLEGEDFEDFDSEEEEDEEEEEDDDYESRDYEEEDSFFGSGLGFASTGFQLTGNTLVILPLGEACLPRTCYLVVDHGAELITRPLKAFGELGQIPPEEIWEKTLPIFDNHRVARRFCARNQRVCKVPDGRVLQIVAPYLQAKGITRLLIDGQVYSL